MTFTINKVANKMAVGLSPQTVSLEDVAERDVTVTPLTITTASGRVVCKKVSGDACLTVTSAGAVGVAMGTVAGTYGANINVMAVGDAYHTSISRSVTIQVTVADASATMSESEPNNTFGTANALTLGTRVTGRTSYADDGYFVFEVPSAGTYTVELTNNMARAVGIPLCAWCYDANGNEYGATIELDVDATRSAAKTVTFNKGKNYLWVWGGTETGTHSYELKVAKA